jgi:hypothetical protein
VRKVHDEELHGLHAQISGCTTRIRWAGHLSHMEEKRNAYRVLVGKHEGKRCLPDTDGRIICEWILKK